MCDLICDYLLRSQIDGPDDKYAYLHTTNKRMHIRSEQLDFRVQSVHSVSRWKTRLNSQAILSLDAVFASRCIDSALTHAVTKTHEKMSMQLESQNDYSAFSKLYTRVEWAVAHLLPFEAKYLVSRRAFGP